MFWPRELILYILRQRYMCYNCVKTFTFGAIIERFVFYIVVKRFFVTS